jgi:hypothetical protein
MGIFQFHLQIFDQAKEASSVKNSQYLKKSLAGL